MGYQGNPTAELVKSYGRKIEIVKRPRKWFWVPEEIQDVAAYLKAKGIEVIEGFKVLPKRWIVERTFAWLNKYRRLSKDYEYLTDTSEAILLLAMTRTMLKRLEKLL